ncbi:MAG: DUF58 domain-containing protein, partial [Actinomycetota bacterium]|nr:DUF58 domain-containing protein [Actinomycetota bacterium]
TPPRVAAGQPVEVRLELSNLGRGATPLVLMHDRLPLELPGRSRFALPGLEAGGKRASSYRVVAPRRGRYEVGPLEVSFVDPFGLARLSSEGIAPSDFLVHPRVEQLVVPRDMSHQRSMAVSALRQLSGSRGEDFYTLREYAEGDDLRKIHWPSTAKRNRYMIRQEETPWQTRATILIDDRAEAHEGFADSSTFERSVEAAASLVALYHRSGYSWRLAGAHMPELASSKGSDHYHRCLDRLAILRTVTDANDSLLLRMAQIEAAGHIEGTLVLITGDLTAEVAHALNRSARMFRQVIVVCFPKHRYGSADTRARWEGEQKLLEVSRVLGRAAIRAVAVGPGEPFGAAWAQTARGSSRGGEGQWAQKPELV